MGDSSRFPVLVDAEAFAEDLYHATSAGRTVAERERARLQRDGIAAGELIARAAGARRHTSARLRQDIPASTWSRPGAWCCAAGTARDRVSSIWPSACVIRHGRGSRASTRSRTVAPRRDGVLTEPRLLPARRVWERLCRRVPLPSGMCPSRAVKRPLPALIAAATHDELTRSAGLAAEQRRS